MPCDIDLYPLWLLIAWIRFWLVGISSCLLRFFSLQVLLLLAFNWLLITWMGFLSLILCLKPFLYASMLSIQSSETMLNHVDKNLGLI
jgi:hypothetical protein